MNDDELDSLIRQTHLQPEFSSSFQREVWARITVAERGSWKALWRQTFDTLLRSISRPAPALTLVTAMLLVGAGLGALTASESRSMTLRTAYVNSINPLTAAHAALNE